MADITDVAMEPHHVIASRIAMTEQMHDGMAGPVYLSTTDNSYAGAPMQPLAQAGE